MLLPTPVVDFFALRLFVYWKYVFRQLYQNSKEKHNTFVLKYGGIAVVFFREKLLL
jgi:hypothetical protein